MILLTGGAGFVGLNVAEQLLARGDEVLIFDLRPPPAAFSNALFVEGDVTDRVSLHETMSKHPVDRVIHMSAITAGPERDAREPQRIAEVNLIGTLNVLEASSKSRVRRFVHASTGALFGAAGIGVSEPLDEERHRPVPESMYGITKYAAERSALRLAALWGLDVRIGRLAQVFGRWEHASGVRDRLSLPTEIARIARAGGEAVFPPLGDTDYIYAPDVARALIALARRKRAFAPPLSPRHRHRVGAAGVVPAAREALPEVPLARIGRGLQRRAAFSGHPHALLKPAPGRGPRLRAALRLGGGRRRLHLLAGSNLTLPRKRLAASTLPQTPVAISPVTASMAAV